MTRKGQKNQNAATHDHEITHVCILGALQRASSCFSCHARNVSWIFLWGGVHDCKQSLRDDGNACLSHFAKWHQFGSCGVTMNVRLRPKADVEPVLILFILFDLWLASRPVEMTVGCYNSHDTCTCPALAHTFGEVAMLSNNNGPAAACDIARGSTCLYLGRSGVIPFGVAVPYGPHYR